ncbi:MAG: response regulator, partial [Desulfobacteraceae bacterium]
MAALLPSGCLSDRMLPMSADTPRVLIVDDEINICRNCEKILSKMDCEVSIVQNGHDALTLIEAEPFDV